MAVKLGTLLVRESVITPAQLEEALRTQVVYGGRLGTNLVELGFVDADVMTDWLGRVTGFPVATKALFDGAGPEALSLIPGEMAERFECFPLRKDGRRLHLAMVSPADLAATDALGFKTGLRIVPYVAPEVRLYEALERRYGLHRKKRYIHIGGTESRPPAPTPQAVAPLRPPVAHAAPPRPPAANPFASMAPAPVASAPVAPTPNVTPVWSTPPSHPRPPQAFGREAATIPDLPRFEAPAPVSTRPELRPVHSSVPAPHAPSAPSGSMPPVRPVAPPQAATAPAVPRLQTTPPPSRHTTPRAWPSVPPASPGPGEIASTTPSGFDSSPILRAVSPDPSPITFAEAVAALDAAQARDEIAETLQRYGTGILDSLLVFLVRDGMALGWKGRGKRIDPSVVELIMLPLNAPSMFQDAADNRRPAHGHVGDLVLHKHFYKALRRDTPKSAVVVPVLMRDRAVNLVYGDRLDDDRAGEEAPRLVELCAHVVTAYERIVRDQKRRLER